MEIAVLLLAVVAVAAAAFLTHVRRQRRRREVAAFARNAGLTYHGDDPFGTVRLHFELFREGDGRGVDDVVAGTTGGLEVRLFDYWYYEEHRGPRGSRSRTYRRFSCALARLPGVWLPRTVVAPETLLTRLATAVGFRDLEFESEEFNRAFRVHSREPAAAYALLDARMLAWLLDGAVGYRFEVSGDLLLVATGQLPPARLWDLLTVTRGFRDRVPDVVASLHPGPGGAPPPLSDVTSLLVATRDDEPGGIVPRWTL